MLILVLSFWISSYSQTSCEKERLIKTWRGCGAIDWDELADTLVFSSKSANCRDNDCAEHNWMFRESGSIEFVFTKGCNSGFNSASKAAKRWLINTEECRIKLISMEGWIEYFDILEFDEETLILIHRKDLE